MKAEQKEFFYNKQKEKNTKYNDLYVEFAEVLKHENNVSKKPKAALDKLWSLVHERDLDNLQEVKDYFEDLSELLEFVPDEE